MKALQQTDTELVAGQETGLPGKKCDAAKSWLTKRVWKSVWFPSWGTEEGATAGGITTLYRDYVDAGKRDKQVRDLEAKQKRKQAQAQAAKTAVDKARKAVEEAAEQLAAAEKAATAKAAEEDELKAQLLALHQKQGEQAPALAHDFETEVVPGRLASLAFRRSRFGEVGYYKVYLEIAEGPSVANAGILASQLENAWGHILPWHAMGGFDKELGEVEQMLHGAGGQAAIAADSAEGTGWRHNGTFAMRGWLRRQPMAALAPDNSRRGCRAHGRAAGPRQRVLGKSSSRLTKMMTSAAVRRPLRRWAAPRPPRRRGG